MRKLQPELFTVYLLGSFLSGKHILTAHFSRCFPQIYFHFLLSNTEIQAGEKYSISLYSFSTEHFLLPRSSSHIVHSSINNQKCVSRTRSC